MSLKAYLNDPAFTASIRVIFYFYIFVKCVSAHSFQSDVFHYLHCFLFWHCLEITSRTAFSQPSAVITVLLNYPILYLNAV